MSVGERVRTVSIDEFVAELRKVPENSFNETETIRQLMASLPVEANSLEPYLTWNSQHYTRNLIDRTPLYELLAICWEVGQCSSVHNHRDQNCWMAVPIGRLAVQNFRTVFQDIDHGKCKLEPADICEMNPERPCAVDPREPVH